VVSDTSEWPALLSEKPACAPLQQKGRHNRLCRDRIKMRQGFFTLQKFIHSFSFSIIKTWHICRELISSVQKLPAFSALYLYQVHVFLRVSELPFLFAITVQGSPFILPFVMCSWSSSVICKAWNSHSLLICSPFPWSSLYFFFFPPLVPVSRSHVKFHFSCFALPSQFYTQVSGFAPKHLQTAKENHIQM